MLDSRSHKELELVALFNKAAVYCTGQPQLLYTLIEVRPASNVAQARLPLNLSLVLDKSGSMRGAAIEFLRQAVIELIDLMQPDDVISVVAFDQRSRVIIPAQEARNKTRIQHAITEIDASYGTQMPAGMRDGLDELDKFLSPERLNRMVLFTDGETSNKATCAKRADRAAEMGVQIIALGLGTEWNESLMSQIAMRTDGRVDYIATPQDLVDTFQEIWSSVQIVARNVHLTLRLVQGVQVRAVWQLQPDIRVLPYQSEQERTITLNLADLEQGGQKLIVELIIPDHSAGRYRLAQTQVTYDLPQQDVKDRKAQIDLLVDYITARSSRQQFHPYVMDAVQRLNAYRLQQGAMADLAQGKTQAAAQKLMIAAKRLRAIGEEALARAAEQEAVNLNQRGQMTETGTRKLTYATRKLTRSMLVKNTSKKE